MSLSNGMNVLGVTGKCWGFPGAAYGCNGSRTCAPRAQVGLSYPGPVAGKASAVLTFTRPPAISKISAASRQAARIFPRASCRCRQTGLTQRGGRCPFQQDPHYEHEPCAYCVVGCSERALAGICDRGDGCSFFCIPEQTTTPSRSSRSARCFRGLRTSSRYCQSPDPRPGRPGNHSQRWVLAEAHASFSDRTDAHCDPVRTAALTCS